MSRRPRIRRPRAALNLASLMEASTEGDARARQDNNLDVGILVSAIKCAVDFGLHRRSQSVHALRMIHCDRSDPLGDFVENILIGFSHTLILSFHLERDINGENALSLRHHDDRVEV